MVANIASISGMNKDDVKLFEVTFYRWVNEWKQWPLALFKNGEKDLYKVSVISIFSESSKIHLLIKVFCYLVQAFLKIACWRFLVPGSAHILVRNVTLLCKIWNFVIGSILKSKQPFMVLKVPHALVNSIHFQGLSDCFCWSITFWFRNFIVSCCSLIWLLPDIASSEHGI